MRQGLSWALALAGGAQPGMSPVDLFLGGGLVPPPVRGADVLLAEVPLVAQHDQAGSGQGLDDAPDPGRGQVLHGAGQRPGHPHDVTVRAGDDLQVHPVSAVLAGIERPVGRHPVDGDQGTVDDQVGVPRVPGLGQCAVQFRARAAGYTPSGKRIVKRGRGRTKTKAQRKLREIIRDYEDGQIITSNGYTVARAVRDWLQFGLVGRDEDTLAKCTILANTHVIPALAARKLRELSADDVDRWLADKAKTLSTSTLQNLHSILKRSITRAQARDKVKRNVVLLCDIPRGHRGRPSKSLTLDQADALLAAAEGRSLHGSIVVSLLNGARTEELRALT
jgi:hypothetical protein